MDMNSNLSEWQVQIRSLQVMLKIAWNRVYQPPLKFYEIPTNNPFWTKSFTTTNKFLSNRKKSGSSGRVGGDIANSGFNESVCSQMDWTKVNAILNFIIIFIKSFDIVFMH